LLFITGKKLDAVTRNGIIKASKRIPRKTEQLVEPEEQNPVWKTGRAVRYQNKPEMPEYKVGLVSQ